MNIVLLFQLLGLSAGFLIYMMIVFKLSKWLENKYNGYVGLFIWIMGVVGIPLAIGASIISTMPVQGS